MFIMLPESTNDANSPEIETVEVEAHLLRRMFSEFKDLTVNNARSSIAMSNSGDAIRRCIETLTGILELRKAVQEPLLARELDRRAQALVRQLAGECETLALQGRQTCRFCDSVSSISILRSIF
jgi:hypothetical protein